MRFQHIAILIATISLLGCQQSPFRTSAGPQPTNAAVTVANPGVDAQVADLNRRASRLDSNNQDLHSKLAMSQRQVKLLSDEVALLKQRLADTARQLKDTQLANQRAESRIQGMQTSTPGTATIRPNNSLKRSLRVADIAGLDVRQEQDVIRILVPADEVFRPWTVDYENGAEQLARDIGAALNRHYRRNKIVIEAHIDNQTRPGVGSHQLTASQALAVFDLLVRDGRVPKGQLSLMAFGENQPRVSNASEAGRKSNRRIELVVYPEEVE